MRPATGSVDAVSKEVVGDRREMVGAHGDMVGPPAAVRPRGDAGPSRRARAVERRLAITPATSHPGRHPSSAINSAAHSPPVQRASPDLDYGDAGQVRVVDARGSMPPGAPGAATSAPHQVTIWCAIEKPRCICISAWIRWTTALMSARCVNACGKFPRWRPVTASISSA